MPDIHVRGLRASSSRGIISVGQTSLAAALGRSGRRAVKREGDGATPIGRWVVRRILYRADRIARPRTGLPLQAIRPADGWCDAPADPRYNRPVRHPYRASAERLWRDDGLYDVIAVLSHNERPRVRGGGSAIFLHVARPGLLPTEGCIAVPRADLLRLLGCLRRGSAVIVHT
ncbi:MAG: L,D-transpeptidase family protein [Hyphomicrobiaceae bacterium]